MNLSSSYTKPDVVGKSKEVQANKEATLSCVVSGLTRVLENVVWKKGNADVTTLTDYASNYVEDDGILNGNSQLTTLQVRDVGNTDTDYKCIVTSDEHGQTDVERTVKMDVFSEFIKIILPLAYSIWLLKLTA